MKPTMLTTICEPLTSEAISLSAIGPPPHRIFATRIYNQALATKSREKALRIPGRAYGAPHRVCKVVMRICEANWDPSVYSDESGRIFVESEHFISWHPYACLKTIPVLYMCVVTKRASQLQQSPELLPLHTPYRWNYSEIGAIRGWPLSW